MTDVQLETSGNVVLDGSGNGRLSIGPSVVREFWDPTQATASVSTNTLESKCQLYLGIGTVPGRLLGTSRTGSSGDTYGFGGFRMVPGQTVIAVWTGGDPGATATLALYGTKGRWGG